MFQSIICLGFGRFIGFKGLKILIHYCTIVTVISTAIIGYNVLICGYVYDFNLGSWLVCDYISIEWGMLIDSLSAWMLLIVGFVSILVQYYSLVYMKSDPHLIRFIGYLGLFTTMMFILITAPNLVQLFLGWEGVGICSYLLITFWTTRLDANKAAIKALLINRIGDCLLLCAIAILLFLIGDTSFVFLYAISEDTIISNNIHNNDSIKILKVAAWCLVLAGMGKSAQIGLHTWLPSAMEGPTPVSALIHAATMVTAGIFLLLRSSVLFNNIVFFINEWLLLIGGCTIVLAALIAVMSKDLKKIIAYSTCSQLGYMFMAVGVNGVSSLFHLSTHAFFKALLFLVAGIIVHQFLNQQSIVKMGGLNELCQIVLMMFCIGGFSLCGLIGLAGYYSKDLILENLMVVSNSSAVFYYIAIVGIFFTTLYTVNFLYVQFLVTLSKFDKYNMINLVRISGWLFNSSIILGLFSIIIGLVCVASFSANVVFKSSFLITYSVEVIELLGNYNFSYFDFMLLSIYESIVNSGGKYLFIVPIFNNYFSLLFFMLPILMICIITILMISYYHVMNRFMENLVDKFYVRYVLKLFGFDEFYNKFSYFSFKISRYFYATIDKGILEAVNRRVYKILLFCAETVRYFQFELFGTNIIFICLSIIFIIICGK